MFGSNISWKVVPVFGVTSLLAALFFLMPFLGKLRWGHAPNVVLLLVLLAAAVGLSAMSIQHDRSDPEFQAAVATAHAEAARTKELAKASSGIPIGGALACCLTTPRSKAGSSSSSTAPVATLAPMPRAGAFRPRRQADRPRTSTPMPAGCGLPG